MSSEPELNVLQMAKADRRLAAGCDVADRLIGLGQKAYFAGGCVRDWLLGRTPNDIDIATDAVPYDSMQAFGRCQEVGASFGVLLVKHKGCTFEIATFRSDGNYSDGRRPDEVSLHSSPEEDAMRRDFTINALFADPQSGDIVDFVEGRKDIENRLIRAVGDPDKRFGEDYLRMLRAVRFAAQLDFEIEAGTLQAIYNNAFKIQNIAKERVWTEMTKLLGSSHPDYGYRLLMESGLLHAIFDGWIEKQNQQYYAEIVERLTLLGRYRRGKADPITGTNDSDFIWNPALGWALIVGDGIVTASMRSMLNQWPIANEMRDEIFALIESYYEFDEWDRLSLADQKRCLRLPNLTDRLLYWAISRKANARWRQEAPSFVAEQAFQVTEELIYRTNCSAMKSMSPPALLDGNSLQELGYTPGPIFAEILSALEEEQLMERITSREKAIEFVTNNYEKG